MSKLMGSGGKVPERTKKLLRSAERPQTEDPVGAGSDPFKGNIDSSRQPPNPNTESAAALLTGDRKLLRQKYGAKGYLLDAFSRFGT